MQRQIYLKPSDYRFIRNDKSINFNDFTFILYFISEHAFDILIRFRSVTF